MAARVRSSAGPASPVLFLLSPADCRGERAARLIDGRAQFPLAGALRSSAGVELGELFAFLSSLYFRGKLTYARAFAQPPSGIPGVLVITPGEGLLRESERIDVERMRALAEVPIDVENRGYTVPLLRDARALCAHCQPDTRIVLLGSVASGKYVQPLLSVFGERLLFPSDFVGRGDMSRGGLLLRAARAGQELAYAQVHGAALRGARPPRLPKLARVRVDGTGKGT